MQLQATDYMIPELDPNFLDGSFGASEDALLDIGENLANNDLISPEGIAATLQSFSLSDRRTIIGSFLAMEGDPAKVVIATQLLEQAEGLVHPAGEYRKLRIAWGLLGTASMAASAFHGYRRNESIGWALVWGLLGATFPVITPTVALAQGFGQRK